MISSNQKKVLLRNIIQFIKRHHIKSLLDVGAGDVIFAKSIEKYLVSYIAVEKDRTRAKKLKEAGLKVISGTFPSVQISGKYDMVLSSHSIPERNTLIPGFIKKAYKLLKPGGFLLLITFKGGKGDIFKLTKQLEGGGLIHDEAIFNKLISQLGKIGKVKLSRRYSTVKSDKLTELLNITLDAIGKKKNIIYENKIKTILQSKFKKNAKYFLRFEHLFIYIKR